MRKFLLMLSVIASLGAGSCQSSPTQADPAIEVFTTLTLDDVLWSDDIRVPSFMRSSSAERSLTIVGHCKEWAGFAPIKEFTRVADPMFTLMADGGRFCRARCGTGGVSSGDGSVRAVKLRLEGVAGVDRSKTYDLIPENGVDGFTWVVEARLGPPLLER